MYPRLRLTTNSTCIVFIPGLPRYAEQRSNRTWEGQAVSSGWAKAEGTGTREDREEFEARLHRQNGRKGASVAMADK